MFFCPPFVNATVKEEKKYMYENKPSQNYDSLDINQRGSKHYNVHKINIKASKASLL